MLELIAVIGAMTRIGPIQFVYTEGAVVPNDVVYVRVHPSVTAIPERAFAECSKLEEVELCEGLLEIGPHAFDDCTALKRINIPSTVKHIGDWAFASSRLTSINLPDGIESIGECTFFRSAIPIFRTPTLITTITNGLLCNISCMFSVELTESLTRIEIWALSECESLRNVAIPSNAEIGNCAFLHCNDLLQLFGSDERIINALKRRFDNLPIHKMIYYQSYQPVNVDQLNNATNIRSGQRRVLRSKLDPTGKQQDCLGMTPLHILTCSTVQNLELYKVLVDKYPETFRLDKSTQTRIKSST